jgi:hypothetical protein
MYKCSITLLRLTMVVPTSTLTPDTFSPFIDTSTFYSSEPTSSPQIPTAESLRKTPTKVVVGEVFGGFAVFVIAAVIIFFSVKKQRYRQPPYRNNNTGAAEVSTADLGPEPDRHTGAGFTMFGKRSRRE